MEVVRLDDTIIQFSYTPGPVVNGDGERVVIGREGNPVRLECQVWLPFFANVLLGTNR